MSEGVKPPGGLTSLEVNPPGGLTPLEVNLPGGVNPPGRLTPFFEGGGGALPEYTSREG